MTLPSSGTLSLQQIAAEFGGSNPISLNQYYRGGSLVKDTIANASIPASGAISVSNFYNASSNIVQLTSSFSGAGLSGGVTYVTFTGQNIGDLLLAFGTTNQNAPNGITAGWTIAGNAYVSNRSLTIAYKFADTTAADTIYFYGSGDSPYSHCGGMRLLNGKGIGAFAFNTNGGTTGSPSMPALTLQKTNGSSAVACATYLMDGTGVSTDPASIFTNGMGFVAGVTYYNGGVIYDYPTVNIGCSVEILA